MIMAYRNTYFGFGTGSWLITIMCLSACTGAQMEAARIQKVSTSTVASSKECVDDVSSKPEYAGLLKKLYVSTDTNASVPLPYLTNQSKPTKAEIADLYKFHGDIQECRKIALDGASAMHPLILAALVEYFSETDRLWADAASGKLTWGKFNEGRQIVLTQYRTKHTEARTRVAAQLQGEHQFEVEQRQRAAAAMQQWAYQQQQLNQQQQMINAMDRPQTMIHPPQTINCNYSGSTATCNSF
jgi:hypothetical protein